jgi:hypothetical protein
MIYFPSGTGRRVALGTGVSVGTGAQAERTMLTRTITTKERASCSEMDIGFLAIYCLELGEILQAYPRNSQFDRFLLE